MAPFFEDAAAPGTESIHPMARPMLLAVMPEDAMLSLRKLITGLGLAGSKHASDGMYGRDRNPYLGFRGH